ncbi:type I-Fv CRISPR-associated protein Cas7fv [Pseudoalteromonas aliena]|uniref:CRISPR-associated protein n=1 Tax=Pseudoalteromonas aliena SW19 TaxID=1314866 RepID=A0ABR9DUL0_9GAMM|nr:type I-Fv CRISPR-associated protein Cas7fv [Pseudoalteromonas aliena]MBE0357848.1 hypothetical protein [Pseudoalteromonas aliena SW19]
MKKVTGIKSVDFKITAVGHGVVNWNGPTSLKVQDDSKLGKNNHTMPKLRGYTNLTGEVSEKGYKHVKEPTDIDFKKTPLYISQNCIRHHLFRDQAFDVHYANKSNGENLTKMLASITGLVRGYVVPSSQNKRTSPLLLEDFVDQLGNGNFEQFGQAGERDSSSFFSKTTFGDTEYIAYGSISIEQLQFISLDKKFDRESMGIKVGQGEEVAQAIQEFIQTLNPDLKPKATFHENYVRSGTIFEEGEVGILLDQDAIKALIDYTVDLISELSIRQAKSYMYVDEVVVDYNDSNKMMRIKRDVNSTSPEPEEEFATYFYQK